MYIKRDLLLEKLIRYRKKDIVKVITGIRRCGKSVLLNEIYYDYLLADGVPSDHIIKVSLDLKKMGSTQGWGCSLSFRSRGYPG